MILIYQCFKGKKLEYLTMIILDSLIFDLYAKHCKEK